MGFMDSYKRLEKLCREVMDDDRRVSAYIDEMLNTPRGATLVKGWEEDLKQLKHYRWVRNKISHDPDCTEKNMCNASDVRWIDHFYTRIMKQTDPLALYQKAMRRKRVANRKKKNNPEPTRLGFVLSILFIFAMVAVVVWILGF